MFETCEMWKMWEVDGNMVVYPCFCLWIITLQCCLGSWQLHVKDIFLYIFIFFVYTPVHSTTPLKITIQKDSSLSVDITPLINFLRTAISLNNASQRHSAAIDMMVKFLQKYCVKPCQHFMQDKPVASWSENSKTCVRLLSFWYFFTVKGTIDVNDDEFNYFSYGIWFEMPYQNLYINLVVNRIIISIKTTHQCRSFLYVNHTEGAPAVFAFMGKRNSLLYIFLMFKSLYNMQVLSGSECDFAVPL